MTLQKHTTKPLLRVLIIDDSPDDATLIVRELRRDFSVIYRQLESAPELDHALAIDTWDLVISDFVMPRFSGLAALCHLREREIDIPFIMVSGKVGEDVAVEAMKAGAHDYLRKDNLVRLIPAIKRELKETEIRRESRRAEEALQSSQTMFRSLVEQSLVGIYIIQDGGFLYVNPKLAEIFGYTQSEIITSLKVADLVSEECRQAVDDNIHRRLDGEVKSIRYAFQGVRKNGRQITLEAHGTKMEFNGKPAVIGTLLDITESRRAEEELRKLSRVVEQSPVSVVITDINGSIEYVNPKFCEITGYSPAEVIGETPRILKSGRMGPAIYQELWESITSDREWHGELENRKKNGDLYWESESISSIRNSEGVITHFVAVKEDITERRRAAEQLRQSQKMEAIGQLAGGISHDFNNLLTVINGYSTLLVRSLPKENPLRREAEQILLAGERAAELTRQLLTFSRRQILEPKVLSVNTVVHDLEKMLRRVIGEHIDLKTELVPEVGLIKADPGQMEQIVMNLVVNAQDALPHGGQITIRTSNIDLDEEFARLQPGSVPGNYVLIEVSDTGVGMSDETKGRIFEPFFTTKEPGKGTGLGLATVYGIVKQSGGYILVASEPGEGTTFKIYLPRVFQQPDQLQVRTDPLPLPGSQTIMVVEDEIGVLNLVVYTLSNQGYRVIRSATPQEALTLFEEHKDEIDLLLTDVVMPFMSGPKMVETMRAKKPDLKVVFMSGYAHDAISMQHILEQGMAFLPKPFMNGALARKIDEVLGNRTAHAPAAEERPTCKHTS